MSSVTGLPSGVTNISTIGVTHGIFMDLCAEKTDGNASLRIYDHTDYTYFNCTKNGTEFVTERHRPWGVTVDVLLGICLFLLSILTFTGNAMVLHAVRTERRLQTVGQFYSNSHI
jgi:hypothetical protein